MLYSFCVGLLGHLSNVWHREHDKKVCCLGLTSLLALPATQLPGEALERVFRTTLDLLVSYKDQVAGLCDFPLLPGLPLFHYASFFFSLNYEFLLH